MNNREYLIRILLNLRSIGIKNKDILNAIEKMPPHYYYSLFNLSTVTKKIEIDEVLEIAKLLQCSLKVNNKNENVLLFGFKYGWLLVLLTNFCKRVYAISNDLKQKEMLEIFFNNNSFKNIYLSYGDSILSWNKVAPFDLIFICHKNNFSISDVVEQLSLKGNGFIPNFKKNNKISMISVNKENFVTNQSCNFSLLQRSYLL